MIPLTVLFFPDTSPGAGRLARALECVQEIILYRLPIGHAADVPAGAPLGGRIGFRDFNFFEDPSELKRLLADFDRVASTLRGPDLGAFRAGRLAAEVEDSRAGLMGRIRRGSERTTDRDALREAQIGLHLAERLDREQRDIQSILAKVDRLETHLESVLGVEGREDAAEVGAAGLPVRSAGAEEGMDDRPGLTAHRLRAWSAVNLALGDDQTPVLTDRAEAVSILDENLSRKGWLSAGGDSSGDAETSVIRVVLTADLPIPGDDPDRADLLKETDGFIRRLAGRAWTAAELDGLAGEGAALADRLGRESPGRIGPRLTAYMLPGARLKDALAEAVGIKDGPVDANTWCGPVLLLTNPGAAD